MKNKKKKRQYRDRRPRKCETCEHCIYMCDGDSYCDECCTVVITNYHAPTEEYMSCGGRLWRRGQR